MSKKVAEENISKALEQLQELAKGHSSRGTAATEVPPMRDAGVGAGSSSGATQVHHTPSNSDPQSWAGSSWKGSPEDGASDAVDENGTDYKGGAEMFKSILAKLAKGLPLTSEEATVYAAFAKGDYSFDKMGDKKEDKDDKADKAMDCDEEEKKPEGKMGKSLTDHAQENEDVQKGLELSPFLSGWADVQTQALHSSESRILSNVQKSLSDLANRQESFNGELAKSVASLAEVLTLQAQRIDQLESTPARGPVSQAAPVEKGFGPGGPAPSASENLSKSQILDVMVDMVQKGKLSRTDVVKFETNSQLRPDIEQAVLAHMRGQ